MRRALSAQLRPMLGELRDNPRLQLGIGLIAVVLLAWLVLVLGDWRAARAEELQEARGRLARVQELAGQQVWVERAQAASEVTETLEAALPEAASPGLAQAEFQGWLRELVNGQDVPLRLDVQAPILLEAPAGVVRVAATISGGLPPQRVVQLIHRIEGHANLATIPVSTIRSDEAGNQTFALTVHGFYRLPSQEPAQ